MHFSFIFGHVSENHGDRVMDRVAPSRGYTDPSLGPDWFFVTLSITTQVVYLLKIVFEWVTHMSIM